MFGSAILEVIIGVIFIFILVSIVCSTIREGIEGWFKSRASLLEYGLRELLHDKDGNGIVTHIYNHPLVQGLYSDSFTPQAGKKRPRMLGNGKNLPSYIPAKNFAVAIMDIAARGPVTDLVSSDPAAPVITLQSIRNNILNIDNAHVRRALLTAIDSAQGDLNRAQANIEAWYDSSMDRVSGWYKRSTQWIIFWIGLGAAAALNVNTITIADYLFRNDTARAVLVSKAETIARDSGVLNINYDLARKELDSLGLPIGWTNGWGAPLTKSQGGTGIWQLFLAPILGILLTALAATLGAPFWFDVLNKVMVIRSTVKPHEKSPEEGSEDRQPAGSGPTIPVSRSGSGGTNPAPVPNPVQLITPDIIPSPRDTESHLDGCDIVVEDFTKDEDLPPTQGGVA